jgi:translation initiation factor IF-3
VIDYKKFLYELKESRRDKAKTAKIIVKEIRLGRRPMTMISISS